MTTRNCSQEYGESVLRSQARISLAIFAVFGSLFAALHSTDVSVVDGSYRCLEVYQRQALFFHENTHMLYPVDVLIWVRMAALLGIKAGSPLQFLSIVDVMNGLAGAASLAVFSFLIYLATSSRNLSVLVTAAYGLSAAFLEQATNANEPMVSMLWAMLAILFAVASFRYRSNWPIIISGALFALSMATFQSMVLLAPAALFLVWRMRSRATGTAAFALGAVCCGIPLYAWAYWLLGFRNPVAMLGHFFVHDGARAFMRFTVGKTLAIPIGLSGNIFPMFYYFKFTGMRSVGPTLAVTSIAVSVFFALCLAQVFRMRSLLSPAARMALIAAVIGLGLTAYPLLRWDPTYGKLWLAPLLCVAFIVATALSITPRAYGLAIFLLLVISLNLLWAERHRVDGTPFMAEAGQLASTVATDDLVVGDWDPISTLYSAIWVDERSNLRRSIWAQNQHYFSFTTEATLYGDGVIPRLQKAIDDTERNGGRVYFMNLLDVSKPTWDSFLGSRCGVPYTEMDAYRQNSTVRAFFGTFPLRRLND